MAANQPPVAIELQRDNLEPFELESWSRRSYGLRLRGRNGYHGYLRVLAPDLVKVDILPEDADVKVTPGVFKTDWETPEFEITERTERFNDILIRTDAMVIRVQIEPFGINIHDTDLNLVSGSHPMGMGYERFPFQDWTRSRVFFADPQKNDSQQMVDPRGLRPYVFRESDDKEHIYGLGMHGAPQDLKPIDALGQWNSDAYAYQFEPEAYLYGSNPFHIGLREVQTADGPTQQAYAMYLDNTFRVEYRLGREQNDDTSYHFFSYGGNLSLYLFFGPEIPAIVERFTELTGRAELPPIWALGLQQGHWTYPSSDVILEVARRYREARIPLDAMHTDIDYFEPGFRVFTFGESYENPEIWAAELEDMGVKWVAIVDPGINSEEPLYFVAREAFDRDVLVRTAFGEVYEARVWPDESVWTDYALEEAREWWAGQFGFMFEAGLDGIWQDMTEPAVFPPDPRFDNMPDFYHSMPMGNVHFNIYGEDEPLFHREFHNLYGNFAAIAHNRAFQRFLPNTRKFVLTRNAFTGMQRFAIVWTGDSVSTWEGFRATFGNHQNMGLSGWTLMGTDFGGFVSLPTSELFARWIQAGIGQPYVRDHYDDLTKSIPNPPGPEFPGQEMYNYPEWVQDVAREYIGLRYRLLPYLYSEVYKATQTGWLIQQPLVYQFQDDPNTHTITYQYMFGESIMVAPVVQQGDVTKIVYFPMGSGNPHNLQWVDWYTDEIIDGGERRVVDAPRDFLPLYVKMNSIIPSRESQQWTTQRPLRNLQLDVYLGADEDSRAEYEFYHDDQMTLNYRDGEYNLTRFVAERTGEGELNFRRRNIVNGFDDTIRRYTVVFHNQEIPGRLEADGREVRRVTRMDDLARDTYFYDSETGRLHVELRRNFRRLTIRRAEPDFTNLGVWYEIYPMSWRDTNGDGRGDLNGITETLDYLVDLGIDGIWLMPIFEAPSDHKFDAIDFYRIDPQYGTNRDFRRLAREAHRRGIKIILDLVVNHISFRHPWFQEAALDPNSRYRDWFIWADEDTDLNETGPWGQTLWHQTVQYVPGADPNEYHFAIFPGIQPDLNFDNPEVRQEMINVGRFWIEQGADGYRLDAAKWIYVTRNEEGLMIHDIPRNVEWWSEFRRGLEDLAPSVYLVGESTDEPDQLAPYYQAIDSFNFAEATLIIASINNCRDIGRARVGPWSVCTYEECTPGPLGVAEFEEYILSLYQRYTPYPIDAIQITNHDQDRIMTIFEGDERKARMAAAINLTMPGNPYLYYGEEIGMLGAFPDPVRREPFRWYPEDGPGQTEWPAWRCGAPFVPGCEPNDIIQLPVANVGPDAVSVQEQENDPDSLLNFYRTLIRARHGSIALMRGLLEAVQTGDDRIVGYIRTWEDESVLVLHNICTEEVTIDLSRETFRGRDIYFTTSDDVLVRRTSVRIPAYASVILE